jgi:SAM-dependent methyltransferase
MNNSLLAINELKEKYNIQPDLESINMMLNADLGFEDIVYFSVQEHYGKLLIKEKSEKSRNRLYAEAYEVFSKLQYSRGNLSQGITPALVALTLPYLSNVEILEIGPGSGEYIRQVADRVKTYSFIEPSKTSFDIIKSNQQLLKRIKHKFNGSIHEAKFPDNSFDLVFSNDVYEHLHPSDADAMLKIIYKSLRKGGIAIIVSSNKNFGPFDGTRIYAGKGSVARGLHINETSYRELTSKFREAGFVTMKSPFMPISKYNKIAKINWAICKFLFLRNATWKIIIEEKLKLLVDFFSTKAVIIIAEK